MFATGSYRLHFNSEGGDKYRRNVANHVQDYMP